MTLKTCLNKPNTAFNLFTFTIKKNLPFTLLASILTLVLSPFYINTVVSRVLEGSSKGIYNFQNLSASVGILLAIAACAFLVILIYINFSFLFQKQASDCFHAMPLSRRALMFSRFFGCYLCSLVPVVVGYLGMLGVVFMPRENGYVVQANFGFIIQAFFLTVLMILLCGAFTLLLALCSGTVFDGLVTFITVNLGVVVICYLVFWEMESLNFYYGVGYKELCMVLSCLNPFAYAAISFAKLTEAPKELFLTFGRCIIILAAVAVLLFAAQYLYNRRKSEKAGTAHAFRFVPFICGIIVSYISYYVFYFVFEASILSGIVGAVIGGIGYNALTYRGFKKIKKSFAGIAVALVMLLCISLCIQFDVFGYARYIPPTEKVETATVRYIGHQAQVDIDFATDFHKAVLNTDTDQGNYNTYIDSVFFTYQLENGETVERRLFSSLNENQDFKFKLLREYAPEQYLQEFETYNNLGGNYSYEIYGDDSKGSIEITAEQARGLIMAYVADLKVVGEDYLSAYNSDNMINIDLLGERRDNNGHIIEKYDENGDQIYPEADYYFYLRCTKSFKNVVSYLESIGDNSIVALFE